MCWKREGGGGKRLDQPPQWCALCVVRALSAALVCVECSMAIAAAVLARVMCC